MPTANKWTLVYYRDASKEWRWRLKAANHTIIATSGEGYKRWAACAEMARDILDRGMVDVVEDLEIEGE